MPYLRVSKKSTLSPVRMPFARKSKIFGLHSIPANTTYAPLKTRLSSGFSLTRSFSDAPVAGKTKCGFPPQKLILRLIDSLCPAYKAGYFLFYSERRIYRVKHFIFIAQLLKSYLSVFERLYRSRYFG